jgi:hypothetical protein
MVYTNDLFKGIMGFKIPNDLCHFNIYTTYLECVGIIVFMCLVYIN